MTWCVLARSASTAASARAVEPPTPASTSSKTSVSTPSASPRTTLQASITRLTSPPEAMRRRGRAVSPAPGRYMSSTLLGPAAPHWVRGSRSSATSSWAEPISSRPICAVTALAKRGAALARTASSASAALASAASAASWARLALRSRSPESPAASTTSRARSRRARTSPIVGPKVRMRPWSDAMRCCMRASSSGSSSTPSR